MDGYAPAYVDHNVPFLVVSGLDPTSPEASNQEAGIRISSEIPPLESEDAAALLRHFKDSDASGLAWNAREYGGRNRFRVKLIGRNFVLPIRSAPIPPFAQTASPITKPILHSALSPLSPGSSLFPDGLFDSKWVEKHQDLVPSAFVSFYTFTSDPKLSTLHDNQLKTDINSTKHVLSQSGYKTRLVVALLSEKSIVQSPEVEERLANIRKATGLDSKTSLFFLPPQSSAVELQAFVETIISTIYPLCIEYYRDLSKHSRRKRNRGVVPPPTVPPTSGTSQALASQGWNVRYDFKLGVFAEFRQEMDAALRSFETGYEGLLGADILEAIASWSPRWNEARLLADVFAIRILRCLLWNGNFTAAVRRWQLHRERIRDFVDRRGKGSATYGWEAWEARWSTVMAEIVKKVSIPEFAGTTIFMPAEKSITIGERMQPWEYLHHPGYWHRTAATHLMARRALALKIPVEDRAPPGSSPASTIASKAYTYDTYLCPEPHVENPLPGHDGIDHSILIIEALNKAMVEFIHRGQSRLVQELQFLSAKEGMKQEAWDDALKILRPLWQNISFRKEGWWTAVEDVAWALRKAAVNAGDGGSILAVDWELMHKTFTYHPSWHYDLKKSLEGVEDIKIKPAVVLHDKDVHSFLSATYTFEHSEGKVGELCTSQLTVTSNAMPSAQPTTMSEVRINFEGSTKPIILKHTDTNGSTPDKAGFLFLKRVTLSEVTRESHSILYGETSLEFFPGQHKVFEFSIPLREAGEMKAVSAKFSMSEELFDLEYIQKFEETTSPDVWWGEKTVKKRLVRVNASSITILPKPPKIDLRLIGCKEQYYTNEEVTLKLEVFNEEEVDTIVNLEVRLTGEEAPAINLKIPSSDSTGQNESDQEDDLPGTPLGRIAPAASSIVEITIPPLEFPAAYTLVTRAAYHLVTDMETPVYKTFTTQVEVINPFEANYDFSPRVHPAPWPSLLTHKEGEDVESDGQEITPRGLAQRWCLTARYASFAIDELIVEDVDVQILGVNGGIQCHTTKLTSLPEGGLRVTPKSLEEAQFDTFTQKLSLDDRGTATLDISLGIKWRRDFSDSPINTTVLAVPRLLVSNSEPRVLAAVSYSTKFQSMINFDVTIENPSNHFLTFGLTMEPSEKFAFSGTKQSTLQLVPLSRKTVRFRILPAVRGEWIGPIHCVVKDRYFQKVLRILATEGMRSDKEGVMVWVPPEEDFDG